MIDNDKNTSVVNFVGGPNSSVGGNPSKMGADEPAPGFEWSPSPEKGEKTCFSETR